MLTASDRFRSRLLTALGLLPLACGGATTPLEPGGTGGNTSGGATGYSGATSVTGGASATSGGSVSSGGNPSTGGSTSRGGSTNKGGSTGKGGAPATGGSTPTAGVGAVGGSTGGTAGGSTSVGGDGGVGGLPAPGPFHCENPTPYDPQGTILSCDGGFRHRVSNDVCKSKLPRKNELPPSLYPEQDQCNSDADCVASEYGYCAGPGSELGPPINRCLYGCVADSDCGSGQICECGDPIGVCVSSTCKTDRDCGADLLCATYIANPGCGGTAYACQSLDDECASDQDCGANQQCSVRNGHRVCMLPTCVIGRPFLIEGRERLASVELRADFVDSGATNADLSGLSDDERRQLCEAWTRIGLMEHASIAAFARFALQLTSFGAPADLLTRAARAMADETRHAQQAFSLASRYGGASLGPGRLDIQGSLADLDLENTVLTAFVEGCIGETVAALEAEVALSGAIDPAVRCVLHAVTEEETQHAELAWLFVQWALPQLGTSFAGKLRQSLLDAQRAALAALLAEPETEGDATLRAHGILPEYQRRALRVRLLNEVISPCAESLLGKAPLAPGRDPMIGFAA
ncbi:MAG TPA: ferritin-like domain-containing protein [Polyangiaceae bacterium]|nr:ferritin-like domain-containing protein [Polyangiaceae bacterium]